MIDVVVPGVWCAVDALFGVGTAIANNVGDFFVPWRLCAKPLGLSPRAWGHQIAASAHCHSMKVFSTGATMKSLSHKGAKAQRGSVHFPSPFSLLRVL